MEFTETSYWLTRILFQRSLGCIYLIGFLIVLFQYNALVGDKGLLPIKEFLKRVNFKDVPSIFWLGNIFGKFNWLFTAGALIGIFLSVLTITGISEEYGLWFSISIWFSLWLLYLSYVNFGQTFYGFGWEILLLEAGFLAIFLGPNNLAPPEIIIWLIRWLLFRVMFGAGMIKLRGDPCWRNLTCMFYHYETQPVPNPLSVYFHRLPKILHKLEVAATHFIEIVIPFAFFIPSLAAVAGIITISFQLILIISGNLAWLNYITIVLCLACFSDQAILTILPDSFANNIPLLAPLTGGHHVVLITLALVIIYLSIRPIKNLFSSGQTMNQSFDSLHLVNTYGAFGSVTRERYEVVIEGTIEKTITPQTTWQEYHFKSKPGDIHKRPRWMSPYLHKLDWQIWFAAMNDHSYHPWFSSLIIKLLEKDAATIKLLCSEPFPETRPIYVRALLYQYNFTSGTDQKTTGQYWDRKLIAEYFPASKLSRLP